MLVYKNALGLPVLSPLYAKGVQWRPLQSIFHFDGELDGRCRDGSIIVPTFTSGIPYFPAIQEQGVYLGSHDEKLGDYITFSSGDKIVGREEYTCNYEHFNTAQGTISFWFRPNWLASADQQYRFFFDTQGLGRVAIYKDNAGYLAFLIHDGTNTHMAYINIYSLVQDEFHHVACRWSTSNSIDGTNLMDIALDGSSINTVYYQTGETWPLFAPPQTLCIGCQASSGLHSPNSIIDDFCIWERVLSDEEVTWLYNGGTGNLAANLSDEYLKAYFALDGEGNLVDGVQQLGISFGYIWNDNLIQDGHMEDALAIEWSSVNSSLAKTTGQLFDTQCLQVITTGGGGAYAYQEVPVLPGETYILSGFVKTAIGDSRIAVYDVFTDSVIAEVFPRQEATEWTSFNTMLSIPGDCVTISIRCYAGEDADDESLFDRILLLPSNVRNGDFELWHEPNFANTVAHWRFNGDSEDCSGNSNELTLEGDPDYGDGYNEPGSTSLVLNGADQYAHISSGMQLGLTMGTDSFTITTRARSTDWKPVSAQRLIGSQAYTFLVTNMAGFQISLFDGLNLYPYSSTENASLVDDQFHHLAATVDRINMEIKFYIDGVQLGDTVVMDEEIGPLPAGDLYIGRGHTDIGHFNGAIDEVQIIKSVLSDEEIKSIASCPVGWELDRIEVADPVGKNSNSSYIATGSSSLYCSTSSSLSGVNTLVSATEGLGLVTAQIYVVSGQVGVFYGGSLVFGSSSAAMEKFTKIINLDELNTLSIWSINGPAEFYIDDLFIIPISDVDATVNTEPVDNKYHSPVEIIYTRDSIAYVLNGSIIKQYEIGNPRYVQFDSYTRGVLFEKGMTQSFVDSTWENLENWDIEGFTLSEELQDGFKILAWDGE